ncbi:hypothetical protein [Clostridium sp.]|uniref:hypothetical protein n=1 Tax=Clostridium sp. TaxID=1506 RepID=UPI0026374C9F|nr:hypothetical protein [Clostridium sp.]
MKTCDFKCILTNTRYDDVHHLMSFSIIVNSILQDLKYEKNKYVSDYSEEELDKIINQFIFKHNKNIGVCLNLFIHKLFHKIYTNCNNTPQQFLSFIQRLEAHEFDTYLAENNLTLNINYEILEKLLNQFGLSYVNPIINKNE